MSVVSVYRLGVGNKNNEPKGERRHWKCSVIIGWFSMMMMSIEEPIVKFEVTLENHNIGVFGLNIIESKLR